MEEWKSAKKMFKLMPSPKARIAGCPYEIPWAMIEPFEKQALSNHDQDLETLHRRGGLDERELYAVMNGLSWSRVRGLNEEECVKWIKEMLAEFKS